MESVELLIGFPHIYPELITLMSQLLVSLWCVAIEGFFFSFHSFFFLFFFKGGMSFTGGVIGTLLGSYVGDRVFRSVPSNATILFSCFL
jgi:prolipoprotein diacylglyceryltransferase